MPINSLSNLYNKATGHNPSNVTPITGSASGRKYYRLSGPKSLIGTIGNNIRENEAFIHLSRVLTSNNVAVPKVIQVSDDKTSYIQEDLGINSLFDIIKQNEFSDYTIHLFKSSLDELIKFQINGTIYADPSRLFPISEFNSQSIMWDLNYFKYCFAKVMDQEIDECALDLDFQTLINNIQHSEPKVLVHRDFQSRNIIVNENKPYFIDFQGARKGPALYDVVSCLFQARINMPPIIKESLLNYYIQKASNVFGMKEQNIRISLDHIIVFRLIQVLGAYGFRGKIQGNHNFIMPINNALIELRSTLEKNSATYPYLLNLVNSLQHKSEIENSIFHIFPDCLNIDIISFSYKRGLPIDNSGNGGGFIFDCRAIHNPGRYEQYKHLTGEDLPVIKFLEEQGEIQKFLNNCKDIVDTTIVKYISRGFNHLFIAFGCTGGQHRSVYAANQLAEYLACKHNAHITLHHREQKITREFNCSSNYFNNKTN